MKPTTVHIFGLGFVGSSIATRLKMQSSYEVIEYTRSEMDNIFRGVKKLQISAEDKIVFAAAKAPCKSLEDLKYNLTLLQDFTAIILNYPFSYMLNVSSDAVYPDIKKPLHEGIKASPTSIHGAMHMTREIYLEEKFPGKVGNIRPTLIYGAADPHNGYGPNRFVRDALQKKSIELFGLGEELRDHIYIDDIAMISEYMIRSSFIGKLNGVSGNIYSFEQIAFQISEIIPDTKISYVPRSGSIPHGGYRAFESDLIHKFGLNLTSLKDGLVNMIQLERKQQK